MPTHGPMSAPPAVAQPAAHLAKFFQDLRTYLGVTQQQAAAHLMTLPQVIDALEKCHLRLVPPWPELSRIVMAYAAWAQVDGRPILAALASELRRQQSPPPPARPASLSPHFRQSVHMLRHAGASLAEGAKRLPKEAMHQARERPVRTFYTVSLPMALLLLALNSATVSAFFGRVASPFASTAMSIRDSLSVQFAPVREGLRWIEVEDPRSRRGDKLASGER